MPVKLTEAEYQRLLQGRAPRPAPLAHTEDVDDDWVECPDFDTRYRESSQYGHQCSRMGKQPGGRRRRRRSTGLAVRVQAASRSPLMDVLLFIGGLFVLGTGFMVYAKNFGTDGGFDYGVVGAMIVGSDILLFFYWIIAALLAVIEGTVWREDD